MAIPGLFVEYLVLGSMALFWALPISGIDLFGSELLTLKVAALAPAMYVLGMFVDFLAFAAVTRFPVSNGSYKARVRYVVESKPDIQALLVELGDAGVTESIEPVSPKPPSAEPWSSGYKKILFGGFPELRRGGRNMTGSTARRQIELAALSGDLAKQVDMRSSRDRIARGTVLNLALIAATLVPEEPFLAGVVAFMALIAIAMWVVFESNSYGYELRAFAYLAEQEKKSADGD